MGDFTKNIIKKGLKAAANNQTANNLANKGLKAYADKTDNKILKAVANNDTFNRTANKIFRTAVNNPKVNDMMADFIDSKISRKK